MRRKRFSPLDPLRHVRRRLALIRYYSAARARTRWTRALDVALALSALLALPIALVTESLVVRAGTTTEVSGVLTGPREGPYVADVLKHEGERWAGSILFGEWTLSETTTSRGWPFPSRQSRAAPRLDLKRYDETSVRQDVALAIDDPVRLEIERALEGEGHDDLVLAWRSAQERRSRVWRGLAANTVIAWVLLSGASFIAVRSLALVALVTRARREDARVGRAARGRCRTCNYDLRGLEWAERCPECGSLVE